MFIEYQPGKWINQDRVIHVATTENETETESFDGEKAPQFLLTIKLDGGGQKEIGFDTRQEMEKTLAALVGA